MKANPKEMYAIVDIETTGGNSKTGKITEIAIFVHDGQKIVRQFDTLVNPEMPIPPFVKRLTKITDEMVATAPKFAEVAQQIDEITKGTVFIGHDVPSDYSFVTTEFRKVGFEYVRKKLCTLNLSRQLILDQESYGLGKLCKSLKIPLEGHHRAASDAMATVKLWELLLSLDKNSIIAKELKKQKLSKK